MTKPRLRNLMLPVALAVLAVVLIGAYIVSYRNSVNEGAEPREGDGRRARHPGRHGRLRGRERRLPEDRDGAPPRGRARLGRERRAADVAGRQGPDLQGQQVTLRQFGPISQGGIFAKFSGKQRAVAVLGDPNQLLAGTLSDGDHVDVVATAQYTSFGRNRATTRVVLRNLLVLDAPDEGKEIDVSSGEDTQRRRS